MSSDLGEEHGAIEERHHKALHERLSAVESELAKGVKRGADVTVVPAWKRLTKGELRWPVTAAIATALALQATLPDSLVLAPRWLLPSLGSLPLILILATLPNSRFDRMSRLQRALC